MVVLATPSSPPCSTPTSWFHDLPAHPCFDDEPGSQRYPPPFGLLYPTLMVTDTAPFRYPYCHLPGDTPERLDYDAMTRVVTGLEAVIRELADVR